MSSDQQVAFENWQQAAEELQKQQEVQKDSPEETKHQDQQEQITDEINQQKNHQKQKPLDPKLVLKNKIQSYQNISLEEVLAESEEVSENNGLAAKKVGNPVLKNDKDFMNYAKQLAKRFDNLVQSEDAHIQDEKLSLFFDELSIYMYKNLQWKNLHQVQNKLKVIKKQRKTQQEKIRKQKQKQERMKKNKEGSETKSHTTQEKKQEDLFGGASMVNSKQQEQERKNKIITQAPKQVKEQEDDDFM